jgi:hypothetical protein
LGLLTGGGAETQFPLVSLELLLRLPCAVEMIFVCKIAARGVPVGGWRCCLNHGLSLLCANWSRVNFAVARTRGAHRTADLSSHHFGDGLKYFLLAPQPVQQQGKFSRHCHHRTLLHRTAVSRVLERPLPQRAVRTATFHQDMRALHQQTPDVPVTSFADGQVRILLAALPAPSEPTQMNLGSVARSIQCRDRSHTPHHSSIVNTNPRNLSRKGDTKESRRRGWAASTGYCIIASGYRSCERQVGG